MNGVPTGIRTPVNGLMSGFGGAKRDRTADLLHAMQALSQLSYGPVVAEKEMIARLFGPSKPFVKKNLHTPAAATADPDARHFPAVLHRLLRWFGSLISSNVGPHAVEPGGPDDEGSRSLSSACGWCDDIPADAGVQVHGAGAGVLSIDALRWCSAEDVECASAGIDRAWGDGGSTKTGTCRTQGWSFRRGFRPECPAPRGRCLYQGQGGQGCGLSRGGPEAGIRPVQLLGQSRPRRLPVTADAGIADGSGTMECWIAWTSVGEKTTGAMHSPVPSAGKRRGWCSFPSIEEHPADGCGVGNPGRLLAPLLTAGFS